MVRSGTFGSADEEGVSLDDMTLAVAELSVNGSVDALLHDPVVVQGRKVIADFLRAKFCYELVPESGKVWCTRTNRGSAARLTCCHAGDCV